MTDINEINKLKLIIEKAKERILQYENREQENIKRRFDIEQKHNDIVHNLNKKIWNQEEELNDIKDKLKDILK